MSVTYLDHFGLHQAPFGMAPDPAMFHEVRGHQGVLDWIEGGIAARAPLLVLTGAVGTGKTTLLGVLVDRHGRDCAMGLIPALSSRPGSILVQAREALGLPAQGDSPAVVFDQIRRFAEATRAMGGFAVLMVDDAQALEAESISALASLAVDGPQGSALTLLLAGQPDLRRLLAAPRLRRLRLAEGPRAVLTPFSAADTAGYVTHRLAQAGAQARIFDTGAMQALHFFGLGVPRLINIMADHCLATAVAEGLSRLDAAWVGAVLREATTTGVLSDPGGLARAGPPRPPLQAVANPPGRQVPDRPQHFTAPDRGGVPGPDVPPAAAAAPGIAATPAAPQASSPLAELREEPAAWQAAPLGREWPAPGGLAAAAGPDAAPVFTPPDQDLYPPLDPAPLAPPPEPGRRPGLWLSAAVVALASGAAFVWLQPGQGPAPVATGQAPPSAGAAPDPAAGAPAPPARSPAPPQATAAVPPPVAITPEPTVTVLMEQALEAETRDPAQAAVAYARAALRGRARAAYYLGQLQETGMGSAPSPGSARLWYAAAAALPAAQRRLQALSAAGTPAGTPATPVPVFQARLDTGASEMIWQLPGEVAPVRFRVEVLGPAGETLPAQETTVPGLVVPFPVSAWRVTAIGADGTESAPSAMVRMIPAQK